MRGEIYEAFPISSKIRQEYHLEDSQYDIKTVNGLTFLTDPEKPLLKGGEMAVYPFTDEATQLLSLSRELRTQRGEPFNLVIDPFSGDGKSGLPIVHAGIAVSLVGHDINSRAINFAQANTALHRLPQIEFKVGDTRDGIPSSTSPGDTLYIANPPFALRAKGTSLDAMRDGGENGLELTMAYANHAFEDAHPGDVILGVAYSRVRPDHTIELKENLEKLIKQDGGELTFKLIEGQTLWRGYNGKKEQPNPMPITPETFASKVDPSSKNYQEEVDAYKTAAKGHNEDGYAELGYFSYIIKR